MTSRPHHTSRAAEIPHNLGRDPFRFSRFPEISSLVVEILGRDLPPMAYSQETLWRSNQFTAEWSAMRNLAISLAFVTVLLLPGLAGAKQKRRDVPVAPLPAAIVNAKKIFLSNGGGNNLAYDAFYSKMKGWGKFELAGSPEEADLIVELSYRVEDEGTRVWSSTNTYNHTTQVHSTQIVDPQLILTIYDAKTKNSLWSETDHRKTARLEKTERRKRSTPLSA
jgi:hypothetical protein